jgi:amino acid adenylation domain-containing protein
VPRARSSQPLTDAQAYRLLTRLQSGDELLHRAALAALVRYPLDVGRLEGCMARAARRYPWLCGSVVLEAAGARYLVPAQPSMLPRVRTLENFTPTPRALWQTLEEHVEHPLAAFELLTCDCADGTFFACAIADLVVVSRSTTLSVLEKILLDYTGEEPSPAADRDNHGVDVLTDVPPNVGKIGQPFAGGEPLPPSTAVRIAPSTTAEWRTGEDGRLDREERARISAAAARLGVPGTSIVWAAHLAVVDALLGDWAGVEVVRAVDGGADRFLPNPPTMSGTWLEIIEARQRWRSRGEERLLTARDLQASSFTALVAETWPSAAELLFGTQRTTQRISCTCVARGGELLDVAVEFGEPPSRRSEADILGAYRTALRRALERPRAAVRPPSLIADETRGRIRSAATGCKVSISSHPVHRVISERAARIPDAVAIDEGAESLRYETLMNRADGIGETLANAGVGRGSGVGIGVASTRVWAACALATLSRGGFYVSLPLSQPGDYLRRMVEAANVRVVLTDESAPLEDLAAPKLPLPDLKPASVDAPHWRWPAVSLDDIAFVIFTSGSTGLPKGIVMPHRPLVNFLTWSREAMTGLNRGSRVAQCAPLTFDVSFMEIFTTLSAGATAVVAPPDVRQNVEALRSWLISERITHLVLSYAVLAQLAAVVERDGDALPDLQYLVSTGELLKLSPSVRGFLARAAPNARLENYYGPSETLAVTRYSLPDDPTRWREPVPVGGSCPNSGLFVTDPWLRELPRDEVGEVFITGASLAHGYLGPSSLTASRFVPDPFAFGGRMYRSGDLGWWDDDWKLHVSGRVDRQVKIRGMRVELSEVEAALAVDRAVSDCAVVAIGANSATRYLVGFVVLAAEERETEVAEIRARLGKRLPDYAMPRRLMRLSTVPLTRNGKVDYGLLTRKATTDDGATQARRQQTIAQAIFDELWGHELGSMAQTDMRSLTFEAPRKLLDVFVRASSRLGFESPASLARCASIAALHELIDNAQPDTRGEIVRLRDGAGRDVVVFATGAETNRESSLFLELLPPECPIFLYVTGSDDLVARERIERWTESPARPWAAVVFPSATRRALGVLSQLHEAGQGPARVVLLDPEIPRDVAPSLQAPLLVVRSGGLGLGELRLLRRAASECHVRIAGDLWDAPGGGTARLFVRQFVENADNSEET